MAIGQTAFPGAVDTLSTLLRLGLGVETELKQDVTPDMMTVRVGNPALLSSPDGVILLESEWITYSAITGDTLTVQQRGAFQQDGGYPATQHRNGSKIVQAMTPMHHRVLADAIIAIQGAIGTGTLAETVQDIVGALIQDSTSIDATYNDAGNLVSLAILFGGNGVAPTASRSDHTHVATGVTDFTEAVQDVVGALIGDTASIDATYNDAGNLVSLAVLFGGTGAATTASRSDHNHNADSALVHPAGSIVLYGGAAAPSGWLLCDGAAVSRSTFSALFTAIGTAFGAGNGTTTFNLPDLRDRFPVGKGVSAGSDALGETGGAATVQLTAGQSGLPQHSHGLGTLGTSNPGTHTHAGPTFSTQNNTQAGGSGDRLVDQLSGGGGLSTTGAGGHTHTFTGSLADAGPSSAVDAHTNLPPYQTVNFIIKT